MPAVTERSINLTGHDQYLFREGTHSRLYEKLGAHFVGDATHFAVWAPNAVSVAVVGVWNGRDTRSHPLKGSGAPARRVLQAVGLHARRAAADHGAPVLRLVGLPDHRLLRALDALRHAAGLHALRRHAAPGGHRRDPRLGAVALSVGSARPG